MVKAFTLGDLKGDDDEQSSGGGDGGMRAAMANPGIDGEKMGKYFHGIYHEKQIGSLCAVHCMNNLCQHNTFDEIQLSEVAARLDAEERAALGGAHFEGGQSANVRADGFFSVQVISRALQDEMLTCIPLGSEDAQGARRNPQDERAFIFNRNEHWYSVRKIGAFWFDLNSMQPKPVLISDTYLQMYIEQVRAQGFSIFVVRGHFKPVAIENDPARLRAAAEACKMGSSAERGNGAHATEKAFQAFGGQGQSLAAPAPSPSFDIDPDLLRMAENDPELAAAIASSLSSQNLPQPKKELTAEQRREEMRAKRLAALGGK